MKAILLPGNGKVELEMSRNPRLDRETVWLGYRRIGCGFVSIVDRASTHIAVPGPSAAQGNYPWLLGVSPLRV